MKKRKTPATAPYPSPLALRAMAEVLKTFCAGEASLTCCQLRVFLAIALREGSTVSDLADACGESVSMVSRTLAVLGKYGRGARAGLEWCEERDCPSGDRRVSIIFLTPVGLRVLSRVALILEGRGAEIAESVRKPPASPKA